MRKQTRPAEAGRWWVLAWSVWCVWSCQGECAGELWTRSGPQEGVEVSADLGPRDVRLVMPGAERYAMKRALTPFDKQVEAFVRQRAASSLAVDPCLSLAAAEYARHVRPASDGSLYLPKDLQAATLHHAGCTDGWAASHLFFSSASAPDDFFNHLAEVLQGVGDANWVGVGRAKARAPYRWAYAIFLAERGAHFEPMDRKLEVGQTLVVAGALFDDLVEPRVLLLEPGGEVLNLDVEERPGGRFRSSVEVGRVLGEHWVELLATGPLGPRVVALFPVYVGVEPPKEVTLEPPPDESMIVSERDAERLMFKLLNADRRRFGLSALRWNEALADIARGHSQDMRDHHFFAHVSPGRGTLADRFQEAGFAGRAMAENISRNNSVYDAEEGLMLSLGHRENILSPQFTDVGVGVVFVDGEDGQRAMLLTQNFATPQRRLSGGQFRSEIVRAIQAGRQRRRLSALELDDALQGVASRFVRRSDPAHGGQDAESLSALIQVALRERRFRYRELSIQSHTVMDPDDVQVPDAALRSHITHVGVGVFPLRQPRGGTLWKTLILMVEK